MTEIAVIGLAARLPGASDINAYLRLLKSEGVAIGPLPTGRANAMKLPEDANYMPAGYLEGVAAFDAAAFGLSAAEAEALDPQQRVGLEVAVDALADAGFEMHGLRGKRVSVYASLEPSLYLRGVSQPSELQKLGSIGNMFPARIADRLGLRGPAALVDCACSSSLLALHQACNDLRLGQADAALVVAVNIHPLPFQLGPDPMRSMDGLSRSYSDLAAGMSYGEAAIAVLLKPAEAAMTERRQAHAIISSTAAIHNGGRAFSLTAPDSESIAEVIEAAWELSGKNIADAEYFEGHGAGTKLGDSLELEGYGLLRRKAVLRQRDRPIAITAAKSAVGHGQSASGLTSFVRAVLSIREGVIFPTPLAEPLSRMINFEQRGIEIVTAPRPFASQERLVGVTNLGLSGTNVHVVLRSAPEQAASSGRCQVFAVGGNDEADLADAIEHAQLWIADQPDKKSIHDLCRASIAAVRESSARRAILCTDLAELPSMLNAAVQDFAAASPLSACRILYMIDGSIGASGAALRLRALVEQSPYLSALGTALIAEVGEDVVEADDAAEFVINVLLLLALRGGGAPDIEIAPIGRARVVAAFARGQLSISQALGEWQSGDQNQADYVAIGERLKLALVNSDAILVFAKENHPLTEIISRENARSFFCVLSGNVTDFANRWAMALLNTSRRNGEENLRHWFDDAPVSLPPRRWRRESYWLDRDGDAEAPRARTGDATVKSHKTGAVPSERTTGQAPVSLMQAVSQVFANALELPDISADADFFHLGGTSLQAARLCIALGDITNNVYPLAILLEARTVREISALLASDYAMLEAKKRDVGVVESISERTGTECGIPSPLEPQLIGMRKGEGPPIFLFHAMGGHILQYRELADALPQTRPIIGVQAPGAIGEIASNTRVEELIPNYVRALRRHHQGPWLLAGHSFGGIIAYEVARHMEQAGETTFVGLLDTGFDWPDRNRSFVRRIFGEILFWTSAGWLVLNNYFQERRQLNTATSEAERYRSMRHMFAKAARNHQPSIGGPAVHLFAARGGPSRNAIPDYGWDYCARGVAVTDVSGDHLSMMCGQNAIQLAAALETAIAASHQVDNSSPSGKAI